MSRARPLTSTGAERPTNLAVSMREAFIAINDLVFVRLAERGHGNVRAAHGSVFQYLDETGTTVSMLAERAQITKQAMAELVVYLESHGYVSRETDPNDRRAKIVRPTEQGREVIAIAQGMAPQLEERLRATLGGERVDALRADLETIQAIAASMKPGADPSHERGRR